MKKTRFAEEQILFALKQGGTGLACISGVDPL
jgi:hypothetical protein